MNVDRMRQIDYWLGIPLCFISSWFIKLLKWFTFFKPAPNTLNKPKALIIALSEMGSIVLAEPALKQIAKNNELYFLTFKRSQGVLDLLNIVPNKNIFCIDADNPQKFIKDSFSSLTWARKQQLEWVVDLELFSRYSALLSAFCGAKQQVGFYPYCNEGLYRGDMMSHKAAYNPHIHISKNFLAMAYAMEIKQPKASSLPLSKVSISDSCTQLQTRQISERQKQQMQQRIRDFYSEYNPTSHHIVLINSQGGDLLPMRNWGQESFLRLSKNILRQFSQVLIVMTGSSSEHSAIEKLVQKIDNSRCINFAGAIHLQQILSLYAISELMVSNDSGPNHFAALVNLPTYTLFGPETPKLYGSLGQTTNIYKKLACSPCVSAANHRKTVCQDNQCMQQISVDEVFTHVNIQLSACGAK